MFPKAWHPSRAMLNKSHQVRKLLPLCQLLQSYAWSTGSPGWCYSNLFTVLTNPHAELHREQVIVKKTRSRPLHTVKRSK
ncbi:hypothetical protein RRG08_052866 [Elysia crispata]|uniref:Uncharacterized protein n=1 Tax=Elysia crispata TaxID=231223 RepID=A0AAE1DQI2_9GAST|nr:hypothetical protein RRG08_052866 [Elysia crispata]